MIKLALSFVFPAVGICIAALAQVGLEELWPGIRMVPSFAVSIDSYFVVLLSVGLCFLAGRWTRRNIATGTGLACALVVPLLWLAIFVRGILLEGAGQIAWLLPITLFTIFAAFAPLVAVGLGFALSSVNAGRARQSV